jgi:hypothetical protein
MTQKTSDQQPGTNGVPGFGVIAGEEKPISEKLLRLAEELQNGQGNSALCKQMSERLRQLAAELQTREEADAEMRAKYPKVEAAMYALLQEHFERELPPLPEGKDLATIAAEEGALPLEAFIHELEWMEGRL